MAEVIFLEVPGLSVIEEVTRMMGRVDNATYEKLVERIGEVKSVAKGLADYLTTNQPWRKVTGPSGNQYPLFIKGDDPFFVYAAIERPGDNDEVFVLMVGLRNNRRSAEFYGETRDEIDRRLMQLGWST